jgi:UDP-N-acetyl-D-mannosaminuronic acid dehydrogenase
VLCTDPYVTVDDSLTPLEDVLENSDILILAAPHRVYRDLQTTKPVADVWNFLGQGSTL